MKKRSIKITAIYSLLHFLVDGICAYAMFSRFMQSSGIYLNVLLYNFCAFALQMPLGALLDLKVLKCENNKTDNRLDYSMLYALAGVGLTLIGAYISPIILGIGNALFHVGGGVGTINEDFRSGFRGQALGVFVAPGAFGLYLGTVLAGLYGLDINWIMAFVCLSASIPAFVFLERMLNKTGDRANQSNERKEFCNQKESLLLVSTGCLLVVIIRSYVGTAVTMQWKTTMLLGAASVLVVVFGKMAGGFLAARFGALKTTVITLAIAALGYMFSGKAIPGLWALFMFNMTMPITLYQLVRRLRTMPGFAFGLLTFGLFLGFLPDFFDLSLYVSGKKIGVVGSLLSIFLLLPAVKDN